MADTIKEFLVGLGFKVDEAGMRRFVQGVVGVGKEVEKFAGELTLAMGAFKLALDTTADGLNRLYFISQRTRTSAENILVFSSAMRSIGVSSDAAIDALESLRVTLDRNPGKAGYLAGFGINPQQDARTMLLQLAERLSTLPTFFAARVSENLGVPWSVMRQLMTPAAREELRREEGERLKILRAWGINTNTLTEATHKYEVIQARVNFHLTAMKYALLDAVLPALCEFEKFLTETFLPTWSKWNKDLGQFPNIALSVVAAIGGIRVALGLLGIRAASLATAAGALFGGGGILGTIVLGAVGLAAYELYRHWAEVGPLLKKQFEAIKDAFHESFVKGIVLAIKTLDTDIDNALIWLIKEVTGYDFTQPAGVLGKQIGQDIINGLTEYIKTEGFNTVLGALRGSLFRFFPGMNLPPAAKPPEGEQLRPVQPGQEWWRTLRGWFSPGGQSTPPGPGQQPPPVITPPGHPGETPGRAEATPIPTGGGFTQIAHTVMSSLRNAFNLTNVQAAGLIGNLGFESEGLRTMQERGVRAGRGGWGWAQWTGPRRREFEAYARENNLDPSSFQANYRFLMHELRNSGVGRATIAALRRAQTLEQSVFSAGQTYERPGGTTPTHLPGYTGRLGYARRALESMQNAPPLGASGAGMDRHVNVDSDHRVEINVHGASDTYGTARAVKDVQDRDYAMHIRNMRTALA